MNRALRRGAPVALALASALVLAGCAGSATEPEPSGTPSAGDCLDVPSGAASEAVTVTGDFGGDVTAEFTTPLSVDETQRTILTKGDGELPSAKTPATALLTIFSATSGEALAPVQQLPDDGTEYLAGLDKAIDCMPIGSRTVTVASAADLWGDTGNEQLGIAPGESAVLVIDVIEAEGLPTPGEWTDAPEVEFPADGGAPVLTLTGDPEPELLLHVIEPGDGDVVANGDSVTVQYQGTSWDTGEIFDQSYGRDATGSTFATNQVIPGFGAALVGQKVGTKLVVTIPPALAYGEEGQSSSELAGQTLVFVVDILGTAPAQ